MGHENSLSIKTLRGKSGGRTLHTAEIALRVVYGMESGRRDVVEHGAMRPARDGPPKLYLYVLVLDGDD